MTKLKNKVHILDHSEQDHFFLLFNVILYAYTVMLHIILYTVMLHIILYTVMLHIIYAIVHVTTLLCIVTEESWSGLFPVPPLETILLECI